MDTIFSLSNLLIMPFWFLMIVLPHWKWTRRIISTPWMAAPAAILYAILILPMIGGVLVSLSNPTLQMVQDLIGTPTGATIAWAHFIAFDLFVGRWVFLDNYKETGLSAWIMAPILFFVLMLGPLGFLAYLIAREIKHRTARG